MEAINESIKLLSSTLAILKDEKSEYEEAIRLLELALEKLTTLV